MSLVQSLLLPIVAGNCFAMIAVAYRLGEPRGLAPKSLLGMCGLFGALIFAPLAWAQVSSWSDVPAQVWVLGVVSGLCQVGCVALVQWALSVGPLSPVWCVVSLAFVPAMAFSGLFLSEPLGLAKYLSLAAGAACVIVASNKPSAPPAAAGPGPSRLLYLGALAGMFLLNAVLTIGQSVLGHQYAPAQQALLDQGLRAKSVIDQYGHLYLFVMYASLGAGVGAMLWFQRQPVGSRLGLLLLGLLVAAGSTGGLGILNACMTGGSAMVFAVSGISQILAVAVISVAFFREKPTPSWCATILLGVLAVVLGQVNF